VLACRYLPPAAPSPPTAASTQWSALLLHCVHVMCSCSYVRKHAALWHRLDMATISIPCSLSSFMLPRRVANVVGDNLEQQALQALDAIEAYRSSSEGEGRPLVAHVFSNGGAVLMLELLRVSEARGNRLAFDGAVFDSSPSRYVAWWAYHKVIQASGGPLSQRMALLAAHTPIAVLGKMVMMPFNLPPGDGERPSSLVDWPIGTMHTGLRDPAVNSPRPELYVYSEGDEMIYADEVREFMDLRRQCGANVTECHLNDSSHVSHFRLHPKPYLEAVGAFLDTLDGSAIV